MRGDDKTTAFPSVIPAHAGIQFWNEKGERELPRCDPDMTVLQLC